LIQAAGWALKDGFFVYIQIGSIYLHSRPYLPRRAFEPIKKVGSGKATISV
jgi:hypothetical protein